MTSPTERLFTRQLKQARDSAGQVDLDVLRQLVVDAYQGFDDDRRRSAHTSALMALELEEAAAALEKSVADLQQQNTRFALALDNMANGLALFDHDGRLVVCNKRQLEILAIPANAALPGCTFDAFLDASSGLSDSCLQQRRMLARSRIEAELQQVTKDGRHIRFVLRPTLDGGFLTTCEDITERQRTAERIAFLAYHDALTELPNRVLLSQTLAQMLNTGPCAVLYLDLDGFKGVNDTLGHPAGDALLIAVTTRLRRILRADTMLGRLGGDEFAAVLNGDLRDAEEIAARMLEVVAMPFSIEGSVVNIGTSIGIATGLKSGSTAEELLRQADVALYAAKQAGRRCHRVFDPCVESPALERRALEQDLRSALAAGQLKLHFQPQFRLSDERITGFEALLRWEHPTRGMVPPDVFIPIAEQNGLMRQFGGWVLAEACRTASRWPDDVTVAVNISPKQFGNGDLVGLVEATLASSGLAPSRLVLEVTGTAVMDERITAQEILQKLHDRGVQLALNDFGTGYSSLLYLYRFPIDRIKINRSFVSGLGVNAKAFAIVQMIARLARSLGIPAVAAGVETREQLAILAAEHCIEAQGFLYSRAVPEAQVEGLLALDRQRLRQHRGGGCSSTDVKLALPSPVRRIEAAEG